MRREARTHLTRWVLLACVTLAVAGCDTLGYYAQAFKGQAELWQVSRPIGEVVADAQAPAVLRERLSAAIAMREFASRELGLPDNGSYRQYADLKRPYVVWNVFATEPFSVKSIQWCFPVAGCVSYKGFFARTDADAFAAELRRAGKDVFVSGVPAYSTLGYFDDPVLSTFIHYPPAELARLIFHELAHQVVYVRDDSTFNESFAVTVEREGVRRWMTRNGSSVQLENFHRSQARRAQFYQTASKYRRKLETLYASGATAADMLAGKRSIFADLAVEYAALKTAWGGFKGYDPWLGAQSNNASLASIAVYTHDVPAFQAMLYDAGSDLPRFYAMVKTLAAKPKHERDAQLAELKRRALASGSGIETRGALD